MKKNLLTVLLSGLVCLSLHAQQDSTVSHDRVWSLKQCIDYALANNLSVQRGELNVESSRVDSRQEQFGRLPTVNGNASYGYSWGRGLDPVSNDFVSQEIRSSNLGAQASLPLINGLNNYYSIKQTGRAVAASEQELAKSKNDVMLNVASLFLTVVLNKELVENARFQMNSTSQQLERTRKQVAAGGLPKSEELNLVAQLARNELSLVQQENALVFSVLQLKQALQMPASEELDVEIPDVEAEDLVLENSRNDIYTIARNTMPEIKGAEFRIESAYYGVKAARGNYYPRLNLVGGLNTNYSSRAESVFVRDGTFRTVPLGFVNDDPNMVVYSRQPNGTFEETNGIQNQFKDNIYKTLALQLIVPIFNGYATRASVQRSIIQHERSQIDAREISNTLRQNIETAYNDALAASKTFVSAQRQVEAREEAFRMMEQRYNAGAANSFEYQVSQNDLFQAQTELTRAKYDYLFRKKVLDFYQGKPLQY